MLLPLRLRRRARPPMRAFLMRRRAEAAQSQHPSQYPRQYSSHLGRRRLRRARPHRRRGCVVTTVRRSGMGGGRQGAGAGGADDGADGGGGGGRGGEGARRDLVFVRSTAAVPAAAVRRRAERAGAGRRCATIQKYPSQYWSHYPRGGCAGWCWTAPRNYGSAPAVRTGDGVLRTSDGGPGPTGTAGRRVLRTVARRPGVLRY